MALTAGQLMQYAEQQALAAVFRQAQSPAAGSVWLALLTAPPAAGTDLTMTAEIEYAQTGYARQVFGPSAPTGASPSVISNAGTITWGPLTGATGLDEISWGACCDDATSSTANLIAAFLLSTPRIPSAGDSLQAAPGAWECQV